jgi:arabinogalactan endo-1,4-beta-galactosidase
MPESKRIDWLKQHLWPHQAKLLAAVAEGIRSVDPNAKFSTHVSGVAATQPALTTAFYQAMKAGNFAVDELGISYYPTNSPVPSDRLQAFKDTAVAAHRALERPVFLAEFGYPADRMSGIFNWNFAVKDYPQTNDGQAGFIRDLVAWGRESKALSGIRPWGPDLSAPGWDPMALFHHEGKIAKARPALDALVPASK